MPEAFDAIFADMRDAFAKHEDQTFVLHDEPGKYYLASEKTRPKDGYRVWYGGVEIKKAYVSVHVMAVYIYPDFLAAVSEPLKKRMQGKSCFNFKKPDPLLQAELAQIIDAGLQRMKADDRF